MFNKRLLTMEEIIAQFFEMKEHLEKTNSKTHLILTVSPVRHTKDTLEGNSVSKSILRSVCHYLTQMDDNIHYYPAYEIMMDDLRDYRFYKSDLVHPNEQGIDYIWTHFRKTYFAPETEKVFQSWSKLSKALNHKPFNAGSKTHKKFLSKTLFQLERLNDDLDLKEEIKNLKKQLA